MSLKVFNREFLYVIYDQAIPLCICSREIKTYIHTKSYTWMFIAAFLTIVKNWKQPKYPSTDERLKCNISIHKISFSHKRYAVLTHATPCANLENTCYTMCKPWKHAKWKKPTANDHILFDYIDMKCPEQANIYRQKVGR